ncbi:hypothetical protein BRCON_2274 [Candidatus Sumerlaea chitinivorans]|uniref:Uncharacterized protein n=1 Tax=Sumerlaea chitinivorans TaxID=2250252 RepID=A0A2Z4Y778_SUMC1|nr:hypothetical protein BRCON_2274 [Candidatus Sumerlaea chitinivorans]
MRSGRESEFLQRTGGFGMPLGNSVWRIHLISGISLRKRCKMIS